MANFTIVKVCQTSDFREHIGTRTYYGLVDHSLVTKFHVPKNETFKFLEEKVKERFSIPVNCQRYWMWRRSSDSSYRPCRLVQSWEKTKLNSFNELDLYLDTSMFGNDHFYLEEFEDDEILVLLKVYDHNRRKLSFAGKWFIDVNESLQINLSYCNYHEVDPDFGWAENLLFYKELSPYEEVSFLLLDKELPVKELALSHGDIICYEVIGKEGLLSYFNSLPRPLFDLAAEAAIDEAEAVIAEAEAEGVIPGGESEAVIAKAEAKAASKSKAYEALCIASEALSTASKALSKASEAVANATEYLAYDDALVDAPNSYEDKYVIDAEQDDLQHMQDDSN